MGPKPQQNFGNASLNASIETVKPKGATGTTIGGASTAGGQTLTQTGKTSVKGSQAV